MSYTTPTQKAAGQNLTAADWNTSVVANVEALAKRPACALERSTSQTVNGSEGIAFTSERVDTHAMHDTSTNTTRITIPAGWAGVYLCYGNSDALGLRLRVNGTTIHARGNNSVTALIPLAVADYVELVPSAATLNGASFGAIWMRVTP